MVVWYDVAFLVCLLCLSLVKEFGCFGVLIYSLFGLCIVCLVVDLRCLNALFVGLVVV